VAASLDLFGDRWTLLILRDVLLGGRSQFAELAVEEGIATNILSERLQRLMCAELLVRARDPEDGRRWIYAPTMAAVELIPTLIELVVWGSKHTGGSVPDEFLAGIQADKAGFIAQITAGAAARIPAS
jgi:DNA-binding HxlR family transcriptional regulator